MFSPESAREQGEALRGEFVDPLSRDQQHGLPRAAVKIRMRVAVAVDAERIHVPLRDRALVHAAAGDVDLQNGTGHKHK